MDVDAVVRPAPVAMGIGILSVKQSAVGDQSLDDTSLHLEIDEVLDGVAHGCVWGAASCYVCEVQRAQCEGRRV